MFKNNNKKIFFYAGLFFIISLFIIPEMTKAFCEDGSEFAISQYGITWTFDHEYQCGQFVNGDFWVVGPVTITNIFPVSSYNSQTGRIQHGSMLNPGTSANGYDNTMNNATYSAALNVGRPNGNDLSNLNPLTVLGGNSLVSTRTNNVGNTRPQIVDASVLTIVGDAPSAGSFRPPYAGTNKTSYWNTADIRWDILPALATSSISNLPNLDSLNSQISKVWLDQGGGVWTGREFHPSNNMPDYGRDMAVVTGNVALALLLDYSQSELNPLMVSYLQLGIDWYGVTENAPEIFTTTSQGGLWMGGGGHGLGRKWPIIFTGLIFDDDNILKYANGEVYPIFQEEQQHFYVSQNDVDLARRIEEGFPREPYTIEMINTAEWGESHWNSPQRDGSNWDASYREIVSKSIPGHTLAATIMNAKTFWNWNSFFDYQDRWWLHQKSISQSGSYSSFVDEMWDTYRGDYGDTIVPTSPTGLNVL